MKDFSIWHGVKKILERSGSLISFHEREIWMTYLGENLGHEQDGKGNDFLRPVLIFKKFNHRIFWGVPLSGKIKKKVSPFYFAFKYKDNVSSRALLSQLKLMDMKRLKYYSGKIQYKDYLKMKEAIKQLVDSS